MCCSEVTLIMKPPYHRGFRSAVAPLVDDLRLAGTDTDTGADTGTDPGTDTGTDAAM
jgi:hypothetical protein